MSAFQASDWSKLIAEREVELPNPALEKGIQFLERSASARGWGAFFGMEFDRHSSAVAMEAMAEVKRRAATQSMLLPTVDAMREKYKNQYPGLGIDALTDVVHLLRPILQPDSKEHKALALRAAELLVGLQSDIPIDGSRRIAALAIAAEGVDLINDGQMRQIGDFLLAQQRRGNGSWGPTQSSEPSLASTGEVVRLLSRFDGDDFTKARRLARRFLEDSTRATLERGQRVDTFDLTLCLRALATEEEIDYELVAGLEQELMRRQNDDGGWPSNRGRDSAIETTGLSVLALSAAGAFKHVPSRLARAIVSNARRAVDGPGGPGDSPKGELDLDSPAGAALNQAQIKIQEQADVIAGLKRQALRVQHGSGPTRFEYQLLSRRYSQGAQMLVFLGLGILAVGAIAIGFNIQGFTGIGSIAALSLGAAGACLGAAYIFSKIPRFGGVRRQPIPTGGRLESQAAEVDAAVLDHADLDGLRRWLQEIVIEWPEPAREELLYILFDRFLDVPSDVAARRAEREAIGLGLRGSEVEQFSAWASVMGFLSEADRRVLFDQVRRQLP